MMKNLFDLRYIWLAGVLQAQGSFNFTMKPDRPYLRLAFLGTDKQFVLTVAELIAEIIELPVSNLSSQRSVQGVVTWRFDLNGPPVYGLILKMYSLLKEFSSPKRLEEFEHVLSFGEGKRWGPGPSL